jgi:DNA-binding transcriptional MerR regulator
VVSTGQPPGTIPGDGERPVSWMGIGEFARLSRLSPKALRLYDELGLLRPGRVDAESGYRWYAAGQLEQARLVASLRQIGVPLAQIRVILGLDAVAAAEQVGAYWAQAEADHGARRELVGYLVGQLNGKQAVMYEVTTRDVPARRLLSLLRHAHADDLLAMGREFFIHRMRDGEVPRLPGIAGAPFTIFHGEASEDSDGPVEWCWPVPDDQADELAARFPDLTLRVEPAHEEAFVQPGNAQLPQAQIVLALESLYTWVSQQQRRPSGAVRQILVRNPQSTTGPDGEWAIPLR